MSKFICPETGDDAQLRYSRVEAITQLRLGEKDHRTEGRHSAEKV